MVRPFPAALVGVFTLLLAGALRAGEAEPPALTEATYAALRDRLRPAPEEQAWRDVGWRTSFGDAVREARAAGRPVFLWAMNGHPLGCT